MITLFAVPKPFRGQMAVIQRNAVRSWMRLRPACDIVLLGAAEGTAELAKELALRHVPDIAVNEHGTPRVDSVFQEAERAARHPRLCYVNADIILMSDVMRAVEQMAALSPTALMVGRRWNVELVDELAFDAGWEQRLRAQVTRHGKRFVQTGIDYFVFPRGLWGAMPPFALGRTAWDNWLLYQARANGAWLIDATRMVTAVHQQHDYGHHPQGTRGIWQGPEARRNLALAGGRPYLFTIADATHWLTPRGVQPAFSLQRLWRFGRTLPVLHPALPWPLRAAIQTVNRAIDGMSRLVAGLRPAQFPWDAR